MDKKEEVKRRRQPKELNKQIGENRRIYAGTARRPDRCFHAVPLRC